MLQQQSRKSVSEDSFFSLPSALLFSALLYAWTLTYPLNIDSSVHAYMASLIMKGYWPYVHVWENNFPGTIVFVHLPEFLLFGRSALAFHAWDILWQLAGTFFLYKIVERSADRSAAWLSAIFVAIFYLSIDNLFVAQRDCYATVILLATLWLLGRQTRGHAKSVFWCGVLYGIAILIRPTNELYVLFLAAWIIYQDRSKRGILAGSLFLIASQVLLIAFLLIALLTGSLSEVYTIIIRFNTEVYSHFLPIGGLCYPFGKYWIFLIAVPFGFVALRARERLLFGGLTIISFLTLVPQKRYLYQYDTTFVLLLMLSGIGCIWFIRPIKFRFLRVALPMFLCVITLLYCTLGTSQKRIFISAIEGNVPKGPVYWQYDTSSASGFAILDSVSKYIADHTSPSDRIQFVGEYVYPLYMADRISATRFITFHSIMLRDPNGELADFQRRWRNELLDTMRADPPLYVVVPDAPDYARGHLNGLLGHEMLDRDLIQLGEVIRLRYHLETRIGAFTFYRRN
jgi:hypothetical protein